MLADGTLTECQIHTYDKKKQQTQTKIWSGDQKLRKTITRTFDNSGRETKRTTTDNDGITSEEILMTYDTDGNMTDEFRYSEGHHLSYHSTYTYDNFGNTKVWTRINNRGDISTISYTYQYDSNDNWTMKTYYDAN